MAQSQRSLRIEDRIHRIETGLLLEQTLRSDAAQRSTLAVRMEFYLVPGASIAIFDNYQIEWARGYGVREAGGSDPITPRTLFQAASISKPVTALAVLSLVEQGVCPPYPVVVR